MSTRESVNKSSAGEQGELTHLIGVLTSAESAGEHLELVPIRAHTWIVFPNKGPFPTTLQETMANIYAQRLPFENYELVDAPTFSFTKIDPRHENYAYSEVWITVR